MDAALEAKGIEKIFKNRRALAGVDLVVPRGTCFGLIGVNGAGKTTFIKTMLGIVRPSAGSIRVLGGAPEDIDVRRRIGYLPERLALPPAWSATTYLTSIARLKRLPRPREEIDRLLVRVGLASARDVKTRAFSKGMKQRLGLAAALLGRPELLVLDEPTDGVDPLGRAEVRELLREEQARGTTVFLNSHLLSETERICDRIGILHAGAVLRDGPIEALAAQSTRWIVRFAEPIDVEGFTSNGDGNYHVEAEDPAALDEALARARGAGGLIVALRRDVPDLESILRGEVGG